MLVSWGGGEGEGELWGCCWGVGSLREEGGLRVIGLGRRCRWWRGSLTCSVGCGKCCVCWRGENGRRVEWVVRITRRERRGLVDRFKKIRYAMGC